MPKAAWQKVWASSSSRSSLNPPCEQLIHVQPCVCRVQTLLSRSPSALRAQDPLDAGDKGNFSPSFAPVHEMSPRGSSTSSAVTLGDTQGQQQPPTTGRRGCAWGWGPKSTPKVLAEVLSMGQDPQVHGEGTGPGSAPAPQALLSPSQDWGPSLSPSQDWGHSLSPQEPLDRAEPPPQGCFGEQKQH